MSRIGIKPVKILEGVSVELGPVEATVKGPQGELKVALPHGVTVTEKDGQLLVNRVSDLKHYRALHGTVRALLQNAVTGAKDGFTKKLELVGIGYRGAIEGEELVLQLGFTHPVRLAIPEGLAVKIEKNVINVAGRDKREIGQFAAEVRAIRPPEPYKGKGVRYQGEQIRMKQGKAMKAAG
ncbi:MAG TPA: 50S ribosomal protein L6 [Candidatus Saccharimonadales bacterium]|nr:50S ribosomal protein L6 [Candidatus Saccharimonadales bacterium]